MKIASVLTKVSMTTTEFVCLLWRLVTWVYNTMNVIVWLEVGVRKTVGYCLLFMRDLPYKDS